MTDAETPAESAAPTTTPAETAPAELALQSPSDGAPLPPTEPTPPPAPEKALADKPKRRPRRGPPADGAPEPRVTVLMTTSRLSDFEGTPLRRGQAVSVPERRLEALISQGKVRQGSPGEIEAAKRRAPLGQLG